MRIFLCTILKSKHWAIKSISKGKRNKIKRDTKGYRCKILARRAPAREKRNIFMMNAANGGNKFELIYPNSHIVQKFFVFCVSFLCGCVTALSIHIYPRN